MIKHIVLWRLKESAQGRTKRDNALLIKQKLEALHGVVPGLLKVEVGVDIAGTEQSYDVALYSEFESRPALQGYQDHPAHLEAVCFIREVRQDRCVVDYET